MKRAAIAIILLIAGMTALGYQNTNRRSEPAPTETPGITCGELLRQARDARTELHNQPCTIPTNTPLQSTGTRHE